MLSVEVARDFLSPVDKVNATPPLQGSSTHRSALSRYVSRLAEAAPACHTGGMLAVGLVGGPPFKLLKPCLTGSRCGFSRARLHKRWVPPFIAISLAINCPDVCFGSNASVS